MVTLSSRERRVLRRIARGMLDDDPRLAALLSDAGAPQPQPQASVHGVALVFLTVTTLLILAGFAFGQPQMVLGGLTVLGTLPVVVALVVLVNRTELG
jgi:Protein of unknown function (DUF3040)